jgi:hypothetical protein
MVELLDMRHRLLRGRCRRRPPTQWLPGEAIVTVETAMIAFVSAHITMLCALFARRVIASLVRV